MQLLCKKTQKTEQATLDSYFLLQNQLFANVLQNRCSYKFHNIHMKTPVLEFLFLIKLQALGLKLY